jgi:excisionase family DNA binding protein
MAPWRDEGEGPLVLRSLTTGQAARHCQVSLPTLRTWIRDRDLPAFRTAGGHYRIAVPEFQRFLQRHAMPAYAGSRPEIRVLIVDDDPGVVDLLVEILRADPRGLRVEAAADGYEGLIRVGVFNPALLILDAMMPRLDGTEVCRRLKASAETRAVRILGISGYPDAVEALRTAGADGCLAKPFGVADVRRELSRLLPGGSG